MLCRLKAPTQQVDRRADVCREADQDGDGGINLNEFVRLVQMSSNDLLDNFECRQGPVA